MKFSSKEHRKAFEKDELNTNLALRQRKFSENLRRQINFNTFAVGK